jgi:CRP/FNR family transcriptional regulator
MKDCRKGCPVLRTSLFSAIGGPLKDKAACLFVYGRYRPRQVLFQEGNPTTRVFALKSGFLKTYKTGSRGARQMIDILRPGDLFGLEGFSSERHSVTAEALSDAEVCFFEKARFIELVEERADLAREIIRLLSRTLSDCHGKLLGLGTKTAKARLASFLLGLLPPNGKGGEHARVELPISRGEIASLIGVRLETVSRLLLLLKGWGILSIEGRSVGVLDARKLKALSD